MSKINCVYQHLRITVCKDAASAIELGYDWYNQPDVKPIEVEKVVVVREGTESGRATVDFLLKDESGQRFIFMVTRALLATIPG